LYALENGIDELFASGRFAEHLARGFGAATRCFASKQELVEALLPHLRNDTTVLVKGSRSSAMEDVVSQIIEERRDASLVG